MSKTTVVYIHFIGGRDFSYSPTMDEDELSAFKAFLLYKNIEIAEFWIKQDRLAVSINRSNIAYIEYRPTDIGSIEYPTSDE